NALARRATYEALGRCVTKRSVSQLWTIRVPGPDSAAAPGRAWGLYRAALRGLATYEAVSQATKLLGQQNQVLAARTGISAAFTRMRGQDSTLARVALPALLKGLSRVARPVAYSALAEAATTDTDHRVRIAALRALPAEAYLKEKFTMPALRKGSAAASPPEEFYIAKATLQNALTRSLPQEVLTAAEWLLKARPDTVLALPFSSDGLLSEAKRVRHWRARATLLQAAVRHAPATKRSAIADTIRRRYRHTPNQYEKAALLTALSEDPAQFDFLAKEAALTTGPPVVPGTALGALVTM
nr:hypothetical protein [Tanacetum cinerariifolium]